MGNSGVLCRSLGMTGGRRTEAGRGCRAAGPPHTGGYALRAVSSPLHGHGLCPGPERRGHAGCWPWPSPDAAPDAHGFCGRACAGMRKGRSRRGPVCPACRELSWLDRETCAIAVASQHRGHVPEPGAATMGISDASRPLLEAGGHVGTEPPLELFGLHQGGIRNLTL